MAEPDLDGLLARFTAWGAAPTVEGYVDLFAEGGTVFDSGMAAPISGAQIEAAISSTLRLLEGFRLRPVRTGRSADTLYVEARNTARLAGEPCEWDAVYCMTASGDRVQRGRRYWDQAPVFELLTEGPAVEVPHVDAGPICLQPVSVGHGADGVWFREWSGTVAPEGTPLAFDAMERWAGGASRWFANSLTLRPGALAAVRRVQARLSAPT
jgi:hypothetical protein